jgi:hypothetical protein
MRICEGAMGATWEGARWPRRARSRMQIDFSCSVGSQDILQRGTELGQHWRAYQRLRRESVAARDSAAGELQHLDRSSELVMQPAFANAVSSEVPVRR